MPKSMGHTLWLTSFFFRFQGSSGNWTSVRHVYIDVELQGPHEEICPLETNRIKIALAGNLNKDRLVINTAETSCGNTGIQTVSGVHSTFRNAKAKLFVYLLANNSQTVDKVLTKKLKERLSTENTIGGKYQVGFVTLQCTAWYYCIKTQRYPIISIL